MASTVLVQDGNQAAETAKAITRLRDLKGPNGGTRDLIMIPPTSIDIDPGFNPRDYTKPENRAHLDKLKGQIRVQGVRVPLQLRFDPQTKRAVVVDGECRLRAVWELIAEGEPIDALPAYQVSGGNEAQRLLSALIANEGKPLSQWEQGKAFTRLINFGWTTEKISQETGHSLGFVQGAVNLADSPLAVQEMIERGEVTPALAVQTLKTSATPAEDLKAAAVAAQAEGKGTAKRGKKGGVPNSTLMLKLISQIIASVSEGDGDLFDTSYEWIEVDRKTLVKLAALVGITEEKVKGK